MAIEDSSLASGWTGYVRTGGGLDACIHIRNDVGGTERLPRGRYRVRIERTWYDYETGIRCIGRLLDAADVEIARRVGTTGRTPEDYHTDPAPAYARVAAAAREFDPAQVYFHLDDFTPAMDGDAG